MPIGEYEKTAKAGADMTRDDQGRRSPYTRTPPKNVGMVKGIEHLAIDVQSPTRLAAFLKKAFGLAPLKTFHRRGRYITSIGNPDLPPDPNGRQRSFLPVFFAPSVNEGRLNHLCFDVDDDSRDSLRKVSADGHVVDEEDADRIYGPEDFTWQVDSPSAPAPSFFPARSRASSTRRWISTTRASQSSRRRVSRVRDRRQHRVDHHREVRVKGAQRQVYHDVRATLRFQRSKLLRNAGRCPGDAEALEEIVRDQRRILRIPPLLEVELPHQRTDTIALGNGARCPR